MHRSLVSVRARRPLIILLVLVTILLFTQSPEIVEATSERATAPLALPDVQITISDVVASGFSMPVQLTHAGDGSGRLFIVEQTGKIRIIKNGTVLSAPFLDLSSSISCCGSAKNRS